MQIDLSAGNSINRPYRINKIDNSFTLIVPVHSNDGYTYFEIEDEQTYNINAYNIIHLTGRYYQPTLSGGNATRSRYQIWTRGGYESAHRALNVEGTFNVYGTSYQLSFENLNDGSANFSINGTAEVGETLEISEDTADADGTGTLSYSWQTSSDDSTWSVVGTNSTYEVSGSDDGKSIRAVLSY